jgi:hypothetical protein
MKLDINLSPRDGVLHKLAGDRVEHAKVPPSRVVDLDFSVKRVPSI